MPGHTERLSVPWWLWLPSLLVGAVLAAQVGLGAAGPRGWVAYPVVLTLVAVGLWRLGRIRISVTEDEFLVDDARLPLRHVAQAIPLDAATKRELLGPSADPMAFVIQRPWVPGAVQVVLDDPDDTTPYWVISSRRPEDLARALRRVG
ncbi:DUF3093 domain-containing protein [Catellatospora coxensis]|uniref:DUF3093 family protein n=1 Tax=Catellatospora coxensis TaxID=310354 RepID=A0A8J3L962_9ACTN|nr:DUF3093 domain-containing protein [Catellatospora coxensis]GIG10761.1 hypothetical protein Cco03nite_74610 [Catellatospora coxensis]